MPQSVEHCSGVLFTDAAHANICSGVGSVGEHIMFLVDSIGNSCPIAWQANKVKRVVHSTLAAEMLSLQEGLGDVLYLRSRLLKILGMHIRLPIIAYTNRGSSMP